MKSYVNETTENLFAMLYAAQAAYYKAAMEFHPAEDYAKPHTFPDLEKAWARVEEITEELIDRGLAEWV